MAKVSVAYALWLIGGWVGLHHVYLGRDRHAFVWWSTLGGVFGLGWVREFWRLPDYVEDANGGREHVRRMRLLMRRHDRPPGSVVKFAGRLVMSFLLAHLTYSAFPSHLVESGPGKWLVTGLFTPLAAALGVHLVSNIGPEFCHFRWPLFGSYAGLLWSWNQPQNIGVMALLSSVFTAWRGTKWRQLPERKSGCCWRTTRFTVGCFLYLLLWTSSLYHNAYVVTSDGENVKLSEAMKNFFNSPAWTETYESLKQLYGYYRQHGWHSLYEEFLKAVDVEGEASAYKMLGLGEDASQEAITSSYRKLVKKWHPDRHSDPKRKQHAHEMFIQIQDAYNRLSDIKSRRQQKNKRNQ